VSSSGHVEVAHVSHVLPDGRMLLDDVSFRIGEGITAALVGPNGAGKTTLLRLVAGDIPPQLGTVVATGGLGVMRQFIGANRAAGPARAGSGRAQAPGAQAGNVRPMVRPGCGKPPPGWTPPSWR
jgi:ABC-type branched-subunit amino acid transport system ATPase component